LILERGRSRYCGPVADARNAFAELSAEASLEEIFFHVTEGRAPVPPVEQPTI
jgi:hypothetical protein